jgi:hypothetical protein
MRHTPLLGNIIRFSPVVNPEDITLPFFFCCRGQTFRAPYHRVAELRALVCEDAKVLVTSATLTPQVRQIIRDTLMIREESEALAAVCPDRLASTPDSILC